MPQQKQLYNFTIFEIVLVSFIVIIAFFLGTSLSALFYPESAEIIMRDIISGIVAGVVTSIIIVMVISKKGK